jgi:effector-binding domain-containing protein
MFKTKFLLTLIVIAGLAAIVHAIDANKPSEGQSQFSIRKVDKQVVLYTIFRGSYDKSGQAIGTLYATAGRNRLKPAGPPMYVYLNNPQFVSKEHYLTEIRLPVDSNALKLAGTLGEMTDVKSLPAMEVAVAIKPEGMADPGPIYDQITCWLLKEGYTGIDSPRETFLTRAMAGNYAQMKSEIAFPIKKLSCDK